MTYLYTDLELTRRAVGDAYDAMTANPCDATISSYERALDDAAAARLAIITAYDADMAERDVRSCRKAA